MAGPSWQEQLLFSQNEAEMTQADWDMEAAIEAADSGRPINPSIEEEMWGRQRGGSQQVNAVNIWSRPTKRDCLQTITSDLRVLDPSVARRNHGIRHDAIVAYSIER